MKKKFGEKFPEIVPKGLEKKLKMSGFCEQDLEIESFVLYQKQF